jgi:hypothetical protein
MRLAEQNLFLVYRSLSSWNHILRPFAARRLTLLGNLCRTSHPIMILVSLHTHKQSRIGIPLGRAEEILSRLAPFLGII